MPQKRRLAPWFLTSHACDDAAAHASLLLYLTTNPWRRCCKIAFVFESIRPTKLFRGENLRRNNALRISMIAMRLRHPALSTLERIIDPAGHTTARSTLLHCRCTCATTLQNQCVGAFLTCSNGMVSFQRRHPGGTVCAFGKA